MIRGVYLSYDLKDIPRMLAKLHKIDRNLANKTIFDISDKIATDIRRIAKLRAPRFTDALARSIKSYYKIKKSGEVQLQVGSELPYAARMETGFDLPAYESITPQIIEWQWIGGGRTRGQKIDVGTGSLKKKEGFIRVHHFKPYLVPAANTVIPKIPSICAKYVAEAIR